jgi:tetratricopeptide (TPR) repeat protein
MNKQNYLYGIIGLLIGLIIGYIGTDYINRSTPPEQPAMVSGDQAALPANHPPTDSSASAGSESKGGPNPDVMQVIEQARNEPSNFDAQIKAAELYKQIGRIDGTLEFYERAAKIKPKDFNLLRTLGDMNFDLKRYQEAEKWYQLATRVNPNNAAIWMDLGSSYYLRQPRDLDKAIAAYRSALKADPRHENTLQNLTRALIDKGDKAAARESLKQLEKLYPNNQSLSKFRSELP